MESVYKVAGVSKQAFHQQKKRDEVFNQQLANLIVEVDQLRSEHPGCGVEKMYNTLKPQWLGRDKFIELFMELGYKVQRFKNYVRTTFPTHLKFPNLIQGMQVNRKNQLWQSDITYFKVGDKYYYLVFIVDVYTRKILGYAVSNHLRAEANMKALRMAIKNAEGSIKDLIHHSDRGSQYIHTDYIKLLISKGAYVSMGEKAQDNAYAERVNGIIKNEYLVYRDIKNFSRLKTEVRKTVHHYNNKRIHSSLPMRSTPAEFERNLLSLYGQKRPTVIIYADGNSKIKEALSPLDFMPEKEPLAHICPILI